ncbi:MAG: monovalent cation/H+ antiporter subunit D [Steroidobacteraceae bacterium]
MRHLAVLPVLLPLLTGALLIVLRRLPLVVHRTASSLAALAVLAATLALATATADGTVLGYVAGNWLPPFGIVLAVDRLTVMMLLLATIAVLACLCGAMDGEDARGPHFHALLCLQLAGLCGAFLTADLFNLFVFFELLLISSYALLLHAGGGERVTATTHYLVVNLVGSTVFLIAVALLYGVTGTLNLADLAARLPQLSDADLPLAQSALLLLLVVFGIKAALAPLYFWLPGTYHAASAPIAALFAVFTKVGVYCIARVFNTLSDSPAALEITARYLLPLGLVTLMLGAIGAFAARDLRALAASLVIASSGTLLSSLGFFARDTTAAALFYLAHSTMAGAALFLIAGLIRLARAEHEDNLAIGTPLLRAGWLGGLFFVSAMMSAGLPPTSGFIAKLGLLTTSAAQTSGFWFWSVLLAGSALTLVALARGGSLFFWRPLTAAHLELASADPPLENTAPIGALRSSPGATTAVVFLLACGAALAIAATPLQRYMSAAAAALASPTDYIHAVLTVPPVERRP